MKEVVEEKGEEVKGKTVKLDPVVKEKKWNMYSRIERNCNCV